MDKDNNKEENMFNKDFYSEHYITADKKPGGGTASALGLTIAWQRGELKFDESMQPLPNGANICDVVLIAIDRLKFLQTTKYNDENIKKAKKHLVRSIEYLQRIPRV